VDYIINYLTYHNWWELTVILNSKKKKNHLKDLIQDKATLLTKVDLNYNKTKYLNKKTIINLSNNSLINKNLCQNSETLVGIQVLIIKLIMIKLLI
jgi:hypothetical protein